MFFKRQKEQKDKFTSIDIAICSLLIHTAKTDEKFDKQEKKLIEEYLLKLGKKKEYISHFLPLILFHLNLYSQYKLIQKLFLPIDLHNYKDVGLSILFLTSFQQFLIYLGN